MAKDPYTEKRMALAKAGGADENGHFGAQKTEIKSFMEASLRGN